jgi:hypothetical protein
MPVSSARDASSSSWNASSPTAGVRRLGLAVEPVAAALRGPEIGGDGKPCLGDLGQAQVVARVRAARLRRHPTEIDGMGEYIRPRLATAAMNVATNSFASE